MCAGTKHGYKLMHTLPDQVEKLFQHQFSFSRAFSLCSSQPNIFAMSSDKVRTQIFSKHFNQDLISTHPAKSILDLCPVMHRTINTSSYQRSFQITSKKQLWFHISRSHSETTRLSRILTSYPTSVLFPKFQKEYDYCC